MRRSIGVLALVEFVDVLGYTLLLPWRDSVEARFGLSTTGWWMLFAAPVVAGALGAVVLMRLSQRYGRKPVLVGTCLLMVESLFVLAWAGDVYFLYLARIMAGLAAGNVAVAEAAQRDVLQEGERPIRLTAWSCIGGLVAGLLLGRAAPTLGDAAYVSGVLAAFSLITVGLLLPETHGAAPPAPAERNGRAFR